MQNVITDLNGNLRRNRVTEDIILEKNENALKQHIDLLLLCSSFGAIGRPFMCAGLREFIAEPAHAGTIEEVRSRIKNSLKYETRVRANDIQIDWDDEMKVLHIQIEFEYVNADKTFTYQTRLRRVA
uniref:Baseplate wedge subunit n=1 Tax=Ochrobactrum phage ORM_20 TaxID=2985243 RepID=A0A9N6WZD1_9VIRU|nr:baseplate wedge subunit [Ochrobactrum phage ORM_20]